MKTLHLAIVIGSAMIPFLAFGLYIISSPSNPSSTVSIENNTIQNDLEYKDINVNLAKLVKPENICFNASSSFSEQYPVLANFIEKTDSMINQHGFREPLSYDKSAVFTTAVPYDKPEIINLLGQYHFNDTTKIGTSNDGSFTFSEHDLRCGFIYNGEPYQLRVFYADLLNATGNRGYVMVEINNNTSPSQGPETVWLPFNNSLVFHNEMSFPVSVMLTSNSSMPDSETKIRPHQMSLVRLTFAPNATRYHYQVIEMPQVQGDIDSKVPPTCIDETVARSLYLQINLKAMFPAYIPAGFMPVCVEPITGSALFAFYANQTAISYHENKTDEWNRELTANKPAGKGLIVVFESINEGTNESLIANAQYKNMLETPQLYKHASFNATSNSSELMFENGDTWIVSITRNDQVYQINARLPQNEIEKITESMH